MLEDKPLIIAGIGFCELLIIAFIALRLCHVVNWDWVIWIGALILIIELILLLLGYVFGAIICMKKHK